MRSVVSACLTVLWVCPVAVRAQPLPETPAPIRQEADRLVREGKALADRGQLAEAIARFRAAEARLPRAIHDCNLGLAYAHLSKWPQALLYLESCKARASERLPPWVEVRIASTLEQLSRGSYAPLDISVEPAGALVTVSTLGADCAFAAPRRVWVPLGELELVASLAGFVDEQRRLSVRDQKAQLLRLELRRPAVPEPEPVVAEPAPAPAPPPALALPPPVTADRSLSSMRVRRVAGATTLAVGGALLAAALAVNLWAALDTRPAAEKLPEGPEFQNRLATFHLQRNLALSGYVIGGVAALAGLVTLISTRFGRHGPRP